MSLRPLARCGFAALVFAVAGASARADLVGYWSFDGTLDDGTANGNNGSLAGLPLPIFSDDVSLNVGVGQSLSFGGDTGHVLVPHNPSLDIPSAMTIAAWVKPVGNVAWDGILAKSPSNGSSLNQPGNYELRIENGSRRLTFLYQRGGVDDFTSASSTGAIAAGLWQHIAVTAQAGGNINFYVNGAPSGSIPALAGFGATNTNPLYIGTRADVFTTMNGLLDEVALYNEALSPEDILALAAPPEGYPMIANARARASSQFDGDGRLPEHAVNGNGLVGKFHINNPPGGSMWLTSGTDAAPTYEIDLGGEYDLDQLRVWNYNENANPTCCLDRGVQSADIFVAGADGVFGGLPAVQNATFAKAPGTNTDFSETKSLAGIRARYLRMQITSNHGDPSFTGLSEVKVTGTPVTGRAPLPATIKAVSSELGGTFDRRAAHSVNSAGRTFADTHTSIPDGGMWLSNGTFGVPNDTSPEITYDLGAEVALDRMKVWNYAEYRPDLRGVGRFDELLGRAVHVADILVAGEDMVFSPLIVGQVFDRLPDLDSIGDDAAELAALAEFDFSQTLDLGGVVARYVKIDIHSNHNGRDFNDPLDDDLLSNFVGLSEVQFFAVPEPATYVWALVIGIVALGVRLRRGRG